MSADDQQFLDVLSSIPRHLKNYSTDVADFIDTHVEKAASAARDALASTPWLKDHLPFKSSSPPPPPVVVVPLTRLQHLQDWIGKHKLLAGVVVLAAGGAAYYSYRQSRFCKKTRRAKRARNGGRVEVVVVAGSPALPLTRSLALDMERRGFVVFVVCNAVEDEGLVQNLSRPDIRPLTIDITDPPSAGVSIERFAQYLQTPHSPAPKAKANYLSLKAVILIPSLHYQTSPIATIPPSSFADLFNTHLLHPILTIQAFLPLLTARLPNPLTSGEKWTPPKVLVFTPSIISSINPPFHAPEATVCSALTAFTDVLTAELRPLAIPVTHVQLGTFDFAGFTPAHHHRHRQGLLPGPEMDHDATETLTWPESARSAYGRNFVVQSTSAISAGRIRGMKGSSLRYLHNAVFDVIDGSITSGTVRVGLGASVYGFVGRWVPRGVVAWMMGIRKVDELAAWQVASSGSNQSSYEDSSRGSDDGDGADVGASHEFVAVAHESDNNVWKEG